MAKIQTDIKYGYGDITLVPTIITNVRHRGECNPFVDEHNRLPIFTAPMSQIIDEGNYDYFNQNGVIPIVPRNIEFKDRIRLLNNGAWVAFGLDEMKKLIIDFKRYINVKQNIRVCLDLANGHMQCVIDICKEFKDICKENEVICDIMTGNIANPEWVKMINDTYTKENTPIDYIRCGIGGGSRCFVDGTQVLTENGNKNIEDIETGEKVLTHTGEYKEVTAKLRFFDSNKKICINNEITCTPQHKFYVINKDDISKDNPFEHCYWLEADKLDKSKHFLVKVADA